MGGNTIPPIFIFKNYQNANYRKVNTMHNNRNEILVNLYFNNKINQALNKLNPVELRDDAKQELFLILAKMPDDKFMSIHNSKNSSNESGLIWWSIRTLCNMLKSDRSTFARIYRTHLTEYKEAHDPVFEIEDRCINEDEMSETLNNELLSLHWYERTALEESIKVGSVLKLSRETGIPYRSLFTTIRTTKKKLRDSITKKF